jgi:SAM-dependent methyltransferase
MSRVECNVCRGSASVVTKYALADGAQKASWALYCCRDCGLEFVWPPPEGSAAEKLYSEQYYDSGYVHFENERRRYFEDRVSKLRCEGMRGPILEIGSGVGFFLGAAKAGGYEAVGIEPSSAARKIARDRYGMDIAGQSLSDISAGSRFQTIVLWQVLAHVSSPASLLKSAIRYLAPEGRLLMSFCNWDDPSFKIRRARARFRSGDPLHAPSIVWRFRLAHLRRIVTDAGLEIDNVRYIPGIARPRTLTGNVVQNACLLYRRLTGSNEELHLECRLRTYQALAI